MANRDCNQKVGKNINTKQNTNTYRDRGYIGDRSTNLIKLIGAERVSRRNFKYALPTYYKQKIWTVQEREALRIIKEEKQVKYYNKTPIKVETIEQYEEYVNAVKHWQSIKKYDGKRKK